MPRGSMEQQGLDIGPLMRDDVPGLSLDTVGEHYFDWRHAEADTLDKVRPSDLRRADRHARPHGLCADQHAEDGWHHEEVVGPHSGQVLS